MNKISLICFLISGLFIFCEKNETNPNLNYLEENEEFSGGNATTFLSSRDAFGQSISGLTDDQQNSFFVGNSLFNQNWVTAPASTTARDGLGPFFNARSCSGCHFKDGKGRPPDFFTEKSTGFLIRLHGLGRDMNGAPMPDPLYGSQIQDQSILNVNAEGEISIFYDYLTETLNDGSEYILKLPTYSINEANYGVITAPILTGRVAQHLAGIGLLEAISIQDILANEDENDLNQDGISGRANYVWDYNTNSVQLGRFGWKASQANLLNQNAAAFIGDIGITSNLFLNENCSNTQFDCLAAENGGSPEIIWDRLKDVEIYTQTLAVPARRNHDSDLVLHGKRLFFEIGCESCHKTKFTTGTHNIASLSNQIIRPYTDMLLHDMGERLADGSEEFISNGNEWRTPPLWGIGLIETVNGHTHFLHDGRAENLTEAILWHGGEAESSKHLFKSLTQEERNAVIAFLNSL